jgi:hypothetical protein
MAEKINTNKSKSQMINNRGQLALDLHKGSMLSNRVKKIF